MRLAGIVSNKYNGETGYVSNNYLSTEKVEVQQSTGNSPANGSTSFVIMKLFHNLHRLYH